MFRNNYQGGAVVEIFSGQGKDPAAKWKLCGGPSAIYKEYNKEVKGCVYCLEGSSQTVKMQMPDNGKMSLGLLQRFLVLQVNVPHCHDFSAELVITDSEHLKRRLHLSTVHKEVSATLLHAKIPFVGLKRNTWSTLCVDLVSLSSELFKGFLTLDGITLFATCKVRRIFTIKADPAGMPDDGKAVDMFLSGADLMDLIPRSCQYPADVNQVIQVFNRENVRKADLRTGLFNSENQNYNLISNYHKRRCALYLKSYINYMLPCLTNTIYIIKTIVCVLVLCALGVSVFSVVWTRTLCF
uniref:CFA20 domain-containing protein n=1 Tax=Amphilophus citrinellus TaxID=61819 RepID=A0A3Q0SCV0_AMPCI